MKLFLAALMSAGVCATAAQAYAHHSFPDTYVEDRTVTIAGELVQILFRNPHSFVHIDVRERNGSLVRYAVEWAGATELSGQGVTRDTLKYGDYVIISGSPGRNATDRRVRMLRLHRPKDGFGWELRDTRMGR